VKKNEITLNVPLPQNNVWGRWQHLRAKKLISFYSLLSVVLSFVFFESVVKARDYSRRSLGELVEMFVEISSFIEGESRSRSYGVMRFPTNSVVSYLPVGIESDVHEERLVRIFSQLSRLTGLHFVNHKNLPITRSSRAIAARRLANIGYPDKSWQVAVIEGDKERYFFRASKSNLRAEVLDDDIIYVVDIIIFFGKSNDLMSFNNEILARRPGGRRSLPSQSQCAALGTTNLHNNMIERIFVRVPVDDKRFGVERCLTEELAQSLGLPNDIDDSPHTRFNNSPDGPPNLTPYDELFLRVLYDDRIKPGMKGDELRDAARVVIRELGKGLYREE
jgi:hypothetical protein